MMHRQPNVLYFCCFFLLMIFKLPIGGARWNESIESVQSYSFPVEGFTDVHFRLPDLAFSEICLQIIAFDLSELSYPIEVALGYFRSPLYCHSLTQSHPNTVVRLPTVLHTGLYDILFYGRTNARLEYIEVIPSIVLPMIESGVEWSANIKIDSPRFGAILHEHLNFTYINDYVEESISDVLSEQQLVLHVHSYAQHLMRPNTRASITDIHKPVEPASIFFQVTRVKHNRQTTTSEEVPNIYRPISSVQRDIDDFMLLGSGTLEDRVGPWSIGHFDWGYAEVVLSDIRLTEERTFVTAASTLASEKGSFDQILPYFSDKNSFRLRRQWANVHELEQSDWLWTDDAVAVHENSEISITPRATVASATDKFLNTENRDNSSGKTHVCIGSSTVMDGQKHIWLQQVQNLNRSAFDIIFLLSTNDSTNGDIVIDRTEGGPADAASPFARTSDTFVQQLQKYSHVHVAMNAMNSREISFDELQSTMVDAATAAEMEMTSDGTSHSLLEMNLKDSTAIYRFMHQRFLAAHENIFAMTPRWAADVYQRFARNLLNLQCDVLVFANNQGFSADVTLVDVAESLNVPTVAELTNLQMHDLSTTDVIVAPSHHALWHPSVQQAKRAHRDRRAGREPVALVISPSVDTAHFDPRRFEKIAKLPAKHCAVRPLRYDQESLKHGRLMYSKHFPCVLIGFVGRLPPGKNAGLFIQAAAAILELHPFARFRIIGDGSIVDDLRSLADRLDIDHALDFVGWVSHEDLPDYLADFDIVINPSLRGWSETFCIANIEVMAMAIPLVTFAVGGIGEYVHSPLMDTTASEEGFRFSDNAVIVDRAHPDSIAAAVLALIRDPDLARSIGQEGRQTVMSQFSTYHQIQRYESLYRRLREARHSKNI